MFATLKHLLLLGSLLGAFLGGFALHHHLMTCEGPTLGQQIDSLLHLETPSTPP